MGRHSARQMKATARKTHGAGGARKRGRRVRIVSALACVALLSALMCVSAFAAALSPRYEFYTQNPDADTFTISTPEQFVAFSNLVNGTADMNGDGKADLAAVDFEGKTVKLAKNLDFSGTEGAAPVGGQNGTSFAGTFDGDGKKIVGLSLKTGGATSNIGIFGFCTASSTVQNFSVSNLTLALFNTGKNVTTRQFENIGLAVGYSAGSISGISTDSSCKLSIEDAASATDDVRYPILNVGGIAGIVKGDITNCTNSASVTVKESGKSFNDEELVVGTGIGGVVGCAGDMDTSVSGQAKKAKGYTHGTVSGCTNKGNVFVYTTAEMGQGTYSTNWAGIHFVGGIAGYSKSDIANCTNSGFIKNEHGQRCGGIVGSARLGLVDKSGSGGMIQSNDGKDQPDIAIKECTNAGDVYCYVGAGGIAGSTGCGVSTLACMNGTPDKPLSDTATYIVVARGNKPFAGGIAGQTYGSIAFCANYGTSATAVLNNADAATDIASTSQLTLQAGYYVAGITGGARILKDDAGRAENSPHIYSNINMGYVIAQKNESGDGYKEFQICGNTEDKMTISVYDNLGLDGMCKNRTTQPMAYAQDGTMSGVNVVATKKQLTNNSTKVSDVDESSSDNRSLLAVVNAHAAENDYGYYWQQSNATTVSGLPGLNIYLEAQTTSLAKATFTQMKCASYLGVEGALPSVEGTLDNTTLVQGVDFYLVAQKGAIEKTDPEKPYTATVVGIGDYSGTATVKYSIGDMDLSDCTVSFTCDDEFDWTGHLPEDSDIVVKDPAGNVVASENYTWKLDTDKMSDEEKELAAFDEDGKPTYASMFETDYPILVTPADGAELVGQVYGTYRIGRADLKYDSTDADTDPEKFAKSPHGTRVAMGTDYEQDYQSSRQQTEGDRAITAVFPYTGHAIRPTVEFVYRDHVLPYAYSSTNSAKGEVEVGEKSAGAQLSQAERANLITVSKRVLASSLGGGGATDPYESQYSKDADGNLDNIGSATEKKIGGIYIEPYATNETSPANFESNDAMLFYIDPTLTPSLADVNVTLEYTEHSFTPGQVYKPAVTVDYLGSKLDAGTDYTVQYTQNDRLGTAVVTIKPGSNGIFDGEQAVTFELVGGNDTVTWHWDWAHADADARTVTVTGVEATGDGELDLEIPASVEHDGTTYTTTAVGAKAFCGISDNNLVTFTDENGYTVYGRDSSVLTGTAPSVMARVKSIVIPDCVETIGAQAFANKVSALNATGETALESVSFADPYASKCRVIDREAFYGQNRLSAFTVPASVEYIGLKAFEERSSSEYDKGTQLAGLKKIVFLTKDPDALAFKKADAGESYVEGYKGIASASNIVNNAFLYVGLCAKKFGPDVYYYSTATSLKEALESCSKERKANSSTGQPTDSYKDKWIGGSYWTLHTLNATVDLSYAIASADKAKTSSSAPAAQKGKAAGTQVILPSLAPKSGYLFCGWKDADGKVWPAGEIFTIPCESCTLTAVFADDVTISFAVANADKAALSGDVPASLAHKESGSTVELPELAVKEGYVFQGWSDGSTTWPSAQWTVPSGKTSVTLTAKIARAATVSFTADQKLVDDGVVTGEIPAALENKAIGSTVVLPDLELSPYYTLDGWSDGSKVWPAKSAYTVPSGATTLRAKVSYRDSLINPVKRAFGASGEYGSDQIRSTLDIEEVPQATPSAYQWYTCKQDGTKTSAIYGATKDSYALPIGRVPSTTYVCCEVTFTLADGTTQVYTSPYAALKVTKASNEVALGLPTSVTADSARFDAATAAHGADKLQYGIATSNDIDSVAAWTDTPVFTGLSTTDKTYYVFAKVEESATYKGASSAGAAVTLQQVSVTFDKMDLSATTTISVSKGATVPASAAPNVSQVNGADFVGWYTDPQCSDSAAFALDKTQVSSDTTLYAKYANDYSVKVQVVSDAAGSTVFRETTVTDAQMRNIVNTNPLYMQFYAEGEARSFVTKQSVAIADIIAAAGSGFEAADSYSVTVGQNGGFFPNLSISWGDMKAGKFYPNDKANQFITTNPIDVTPSLALSYAGDVYSGETTAVEVAESCGETDHVYVTSGCLRTFLGISGDYNKDNSAAYAGNRSASGADTVRIIVPTTTLSFNSKGGSEVAAQTVEAGTTPTQPAAPHKAGYVFDGWYADEGCTEGNEFNFTKTLDANQTVYAKWTAVPLSAEATGASGVYGYAAGSLAASVATTPTVSDASYQWYEIADGGTEGAAIDGATDATYVLPEGRDAGSYSFYCKVKTGSGADTNEATSNTVQIEVAKVQVAIEGAPAVTAGNLAATGFIVTPPAVTGVDADRLEYAVSTSSSSVPESGWQFSTSFSGLSPETEYYIFARVADDANHEGATYLPGANESVTTKKLGTVEEPDIAERTYSPSAKVGDIKLPAGWAWDSADAAKTPTVVNTGYKAVYGPAAGTEDYSSYSGWDAGTRTITMNVPVPVVCADVANVKVAQIAAQAYTGKAVTPKPAVTMDGCTLVASSDYTLSYANNVRPGTATVTITGKGNYTGTQKVTFTIKGAGADAWKRLAGNTAIGTMKQIVNEGWDKSDYAIVATTAGYYDALSASGLAGLLGCPILMTAPDKLTDTTAKLITAKKVKNVIVVGGTSAVSANTFNQIKKLSGVSSVERVAGNTAIGTANKIYERGKKVGSGWGTDAIVATASGYQDALSIAPYAYAKKAPIFLAKGKPGTLADTSSKAIKNGKFERTIIAGGTAAVASSVESQVTTKKERLWGNTAYGTSRKIADFCIKEGMEVAHMGVATGRAYYDALAGAALCGSKNSILILADDGNNNNVNNVVKVYKDKLEKSCYIFGGTSAVSTSVESKIKTASK